MTNKSNQLVYINYIGCEKRKLDAQRLVNFFIANNFQLTNKPNNADYIVYITCAFCKQYEDWSVENIQKLFSKLKNRGKLIIGGCLTSINSSRLQKFPDIDVMTVRNLEKIDDIINPSISIKKIPDPNITIFEDFIYDTQKIDKNRTPAHNEYEKAKRGFKIRLNFGCLGNCSYCVTRFATQKLKSKPLKLVINEFLEAVDTKQKTILFTGGDTGAYGLDISLTIVDLLNKILNYEANYKIYFHDFGIRWLIKYFEGLLSIMKRKKEKFGIFNFPIQSGSNRILKLMRRNYRIEDVIRCLNRIKKEIPEIKYGTHLIVGFPSESELDFKESLKLINQVQFDFLMVYEYSDNPLADSYNLSGKINDLEIKRRYSILMNNYYENFNKMRLGN